MDTTYVIWALSIFCLTVLVLVLRAMPAALKQEASERIQALLPVLNPEMICPHCQTRGTVSTKQVQIKGGVSGGKVVAAVFTGGWSLLATGIARKQGTTEASCSKCAAKWHFQ